MKIRRTMLKNFAASALLLLAVHDAHAQQRATGRSPAGRLGKPAEGRDFASPIIKITEVAGAVQKDERKRSIVVGTDQSTSIKGLPDGSGDVALFGIVEDDRLVTSLQGNGKNLLLQGEPKRKRFAVRMRAPAMDSSFTLSFVATDAAGNLAKILVDVKGPTGLDPLTYVELKSAPAPPPDSVDPTSGRYWALIIGVSDYSHPSMSDLAYPINDAQDMANILTQSYSFDLSHTRLLPNPTRAMLVGALSDYAPSGQTPLGENDNLLVFYAGHGHYDKDYNEGYWLPADAEAQNRGNWISNSDVQRAFKAIKAKHILLLSDACFSGSMFATREVIIPKSIREAYRVSSRKAMTAGNFVTVPDRSEFKKYISKCLLENTKTYLDAGSLYNNLKEPVGNNSELPLYGTIQNAGDEGGEFIFVKRN